MGVLEYIHKSDPFPKYESPCKGNLHVMDYAKLDLAIGKRMRK